MSFSPVSRLLCRYACGLNTSSALAGGANRRVAKGEVGLLGVKSSDAFVTVRENDDLAADYCHREQTLDKLTHTHVTLQHRRRCSSKA